ncbi:hypothetical protein [Protaetiibacter intestinalis]|uniref:AbiEi antitoxin C-terminal domain-containing protein n=1 Tax=Protaetiibacter intestinalis TaxID=2419774 RepID=A0A387B4Y4_9MICO|nr:hypothetical protein [Protaetiibacter intestinalis]AYF98734.1 hypothetical protein D7I47_11055 [Protaetiibacter intestinalis]
MNTRLHRITRPEALDQGFTDRQVAALIRLKQLHRVRPGEYALPEEWTTAEPHERHRELVLRTSERVAEPQVYSHLAAAALWGIRILGTWPTRVDVLVPRSSGGRSSGRLRRHAIGYDDRDVVELDGILVTSPAQTVVDLARMLPFMDAVVAADSALGTAFGRAPLTTLDEISKIVRAAGRGRGVARARAALAFADRRAEAPPETVSRVGATVLGFPPPEPQKEFATASGRRRVDLWWGAFGRVGESDGRAKYTDPALLRGRSPDEVFRREKQRDRELLALPEVDGITHWEPAELYSPAKFYDILRAAGLPTRLPRPRFTSWSSPDVALAAARLRPSDARQSSASGATHPYRG